MIPAPARKKIDDAVIQTFLNNRLKSPDITFTMSAHLVFARQPLETEDVLVDVKRLVDRTATRKQVIDDLIAGRFTVPPITAQAMGDDRRNYQEVWVKGAPIEDGQRECADRYKVIRNFCMQYDRPFTVLDIGANLGYFAVRLTEDFDCTVVADEGFFVKPLIQVLRLNQSDRIVMVDHVFNLQTLRQLAEVEHFDVVLGMSILHHLQGGTPAELFDAMRALGDHLILELPFEKSIQVVGNLKDAVNLKLPPEAKLIGHGKSHLEQGERPIYHIPTPKKTLKRAYIGAHESTDIRIKSDFKTKTVKVGDDAERPWKRGVNLLTYGAFGGCFPSRLHVRSMMQDKKYKTAIDAGNIIVQGRRLVALK